MRVADGVSGLWLEAEFIEGRDKDGNADLTFTVQIRGNRGQWAENKERASQMAGEVVQLLLDKRLKPAEVVPLPGAE